MRLIGRIVEYTSRAEIRMDRALAPTEVGCVIRVKPRPESEFRIGDAEVIAISGDVLQFRGPLWCSIPAVAEHDYVYLVYPEIVSS